MTDTAMAKAADIEELAQRARDILNKKDPETGLLNPEKWGSFIKKVKGSGYLVQIPFYEVASVDLDKKRENGAVRTVKDVYLVAAEDVRQYFHPIIAAMASEGFSYKTGLLGRVLKDTDPPSGSFEDNLRDVLSLPDPNDPVTICGKKYLPFRADSEGPIWRKLGILAHVGHYLQLGDPAITPEERAFWEPVVKDVVRNDLKRPTLRDRFNMSARAVHFKKLGVPLTAELVIPESVQAPLAPEAA